MRAGEPTTERSEQIPDAVRRLADERGFGELQLVRREVPMAMAVIRGGVLVGASILLIWLLSTLVPDPDGFSIGYSILHVVVVFLFFTLIGGATYVIRGLVVGSRSHYLYDGGLIRNRRGGPRAFAWSDVSAIKAIYNKRQSGNEGKVLGYQVNTADGTRYPIPLLLVDGRDTFIDRVISILREHGRPIH